MPRSRIDEENLLAEMLEDLSKASGLDIGEILADTFPDEEELEIPGFSMTSERGERDLDDDDRDVTPFTTSGIFEEETDAEELEIDNDYSDDTEEYFDDLFDDLDVDPNDEEDIYGDD